MFMGKFRPKFLNIKFYQKVVWGSCGSTVICHSSFDYVKCEASATFLTSRCESIILGKDGNVSMWNYVTSKVSTVKIILGSCRNIS